MKVGNTILRFVFVVVLNLMLLLGSIPLSKLYAQKTMYLDVITANDQYYGVLLYADSSGVFIRENGKVVGMSPGCIDILKTGSSAKDKVDIKGFENRYYSLLPLLRKHAKHPYRFQEWEQLNLEAFVYEGNSDDLSTVTIPAHVFLEIGGGFMSTPANEQMLEDFQPFGGTTSFFGLTTTYPFDNSRAESSYFRFGIHPSTRLDIHFTFRNIGKQQIRGISDFNFLVKSNNLGFTFNYLLTSPDFFLSSRWKVGIGGGPSLSNTKSEVVLIRSGYTDPFFGLFISDDTETIRNTVSSLAFNINLKVDYFFARHFYMTSSVENIFSPPVSISSRDMEIYTFDGAEFKTSTFNFSFGIGSNLY